MDAKRKKGGYGCNKKGATSKIVQIQRTRKGEDTKKIADSERGKKEQGRGNKEIKSREESARKRQGKKRQCSDERAVKRSR